LVALPAVKNRPRKMCQGFCFPVVEQSRVFEKPEMRRVAWENEIDRKVVHFGHFSGLTSE